MDEERRRRPYNNDKLRHRHPKAYALFWWIAIPIGVALIAGVIVLALLQTPGVQKFSLRTLGVLQLEPGEPGLPLSYSQITGIFPWSFVVHNLTLDDPTGLLIRTNSSEFSMRVLDLLAGDVTLENVVLEGAVIGSQKPRAVVASSGGAGSDAADPQPPWWPKLGIRLEIKDFRANGLVVEALGASFAFSGSMRIEEQGGDVEIDATIAYESRNETVVHLSVEGGGLDQIVRTSLEVSKTGVLCGDGCESPSSVLSYGNVSASGTGNWYRWMELAFSRRFNLSGLIEQGVDQPISGRAQWNSTDPSKLVRLMDARFSVDAETGVRSVDEMVVRLRDSLGSFRAEARYYEDSIWWLVLNASAPGVGIRLPFVEAIDGSLFYNSTHGGHWSAGKNGIPLVGDVVTSGNFSVSSRSVELRDIAIRTGLFELDGNVTYEIGSRLTGSFHDPKGNLASALRLATAPDGTYGVEFAIENHRIVQTGLTARNFSLAGSLRGLPSQPIGSVSARIDDLQVKAGALAIDTLSVDASRAEPAQGWTVAATSVGSSLSGVVSVHVAKDVRDGVLACTVQPFALRARGVPLYTKAASELAFDFSRDLYSVAASVYSSNASSPSFVLEMRGDKVRVEVDEDANVLGKLAGLERKRLSGPVNGSLYVTELVRLIPSLSSVDMCWTGGRVVDETAGSVARDIRACLKGDPAAGWRLDPLDLSVEPDMRVSLSGRVDLGFANGSISLVPVSTKATVSGSLAGLLSYSAQAAASANFTVIMLN